MTYLEIVNNVLRRLREREVATVNESAYSKLIGDFVNDAKEEIENAWDWSHLRTTITATTTSGIFAYVLTDSGTRMKVLNVYNDTDNYEMSYRSSDRMTKDYLSSPASGSPRYYSFNGVDINGDTIAEVYPKPNKEYLLRFNMVIRPGALTSDTDILYAPERPTLMLAYAKAVEERGEDGGNSGLSAYATANRVLNDTLAFDQAKHPEELIWTTP